MPDYISKYRAMGKGADKNVLVVFVEDMLEELGGSTN